MLDVDHMVMLICDETSVSNKPLEELTFKKNS